MLEGPPNHWTGPWVWGFAPSSSLPGILLLALPCPSFLELGAVPSPMYPKHQTQHHTHIHTHIMMPYTLQSHSYTLQSQLHTLWSHDSIHTHTHTHIPVTPTTPHNTPATPLAPLHKHPQASTSTTPVFPRPQSPHHQCGEQPCPVSAVPGVRLYPQVPGDMSPSEQNLGLTALEQEVASLP